MPGRVFMDGWFRQNPAMTSQYPATFRHHQPLSSPSHGQTILYSVCFVEIITQSPVETQTSGLTQGDDFYVLNIGHLPEVSI